MPDVEEILRLVAEGAISPEEAEQVLAALDADDATGPQAGRKERPSWPDQAAGERARQLRIEITEGGRRVVNLRVPINVAGMVAGIVPGLPDEEAERIRSTIRAGLRGPIVDIGDDQGDRVLIVSE